MDWLIWAIEWLEVVAHWIWIFIVGTTVLYVVALIVLLPVIHMETDEGRSEMKRLVLATIVALAVSPAMAGSAELRRHRFAECMQGVHMKFEHDRTHFGLGTENRVRGACCKS